MIDITENRKVIKQGKKYSMKYPKKNEWFKIYKKYYYMQPK